jgi:outer membrane protein assembly factor BamB
VWKYSVSHSILSTPNVNNGIVYIANSTDLYALNAANGHLIWHKQAGGYGTTGHSWPSVANGLVFMGASDGNLYAYNAGTGHVQWTFHDQVGLGSPQAA